MKKITLIALMFGIIAVSCKKDESESDSINNSSNNTSSNVNSFNRIMSQFVLPDDANEELVRIFGDASDVDYSIGVSTQPNYGHYTPEFDCYLMGGQSPIQSISIGGDMYFPDGDGQFFQQGSQIDHHFGKMVDITLSDGTDSYNFQRYIPQPLMVNYIGNDVTNSIQRAGNDITWTPDPNNPSNKVAFLYELYDSDDIFTHRVPIDRNIILIENNGSYNFDHLLSDNVKGIYFQVVNGNTVSLMLGEDKVTLDFSSKDHHEYIIED